MPWIFACFELLLLLLLITTPRGKEGGMPRGFGGVRSLLLLPLRAVAAAPCAARPVAGGLDGDQERESWSTLQHPGLLEKEGGAPTRWQLWGCGSRRICHRRTR